MLILYWRGWWGLNSHYLSFLEDDCSHPVELQPHVMALSFWCGCDRMVISVGSAVRERGCAAAGILPAHWFNTRQSQWKQVLNQLEPRSISWQHKSARLLIFTLSRNHSCNICPCILILLEHWKHVLSSLFVVFHSPHQQSKNHTQHNQEE